MQPLAGVPSESSVECTAAWDTPAPARKADTREVTCPALAMSGAGGKPGRSLPSKLAMHHLCRASNNNGIA